METPTTDNSAPVSLDQLLGRGDIWVGQAKRSAPGSTVASGYEQLDKALTGGWPRGSLLEICQQGAAHTEWYLLSPVMAGLKGAIFLLDPPMVPFGATLSDLGIDLSRLYIVRTGGKALFVSAFVELARSSQCGALLAWQPKDSLTYTELRKMLLACAEGAGVYTLFRPSGVQKESSPASLRVLASVQRREIKLSIFKQRGMLESHDTVIRLSLPEKLDGHIPLNRLHELRLPGMPPLATTRRKLATVIPLRRR